MGCGVSKLDPTQDDIPDRIKPIPSKRTTNKNNNNNSDGKKDDDHHHSQGSDNHPQHQQQQQHDDEVITSSRSRNNSLDRNSSSFNVTQDCPPTLQKINESQITTTMPPPDECEAAAGGGDTIDEETRVWRRRHVSSEGSLNIMEEEIIMGLDHDESFDHQRALSHHPSPSFRVYCTDFPDDHLILDEHVGDENSMEDERKSIGQESSCCSNDVSVRQVPSKKWKRRGKMFKITMPKGGKIYKNMQSFYYFPCSSHPNNAHLLQKAAA